MLYFSIQNRVQGRTSKVSEAAGARCDFMIGLCSDYPRIVFILAETIQRVSAAILNLAGAVFGEVRGWLCLLRALEMTFHMRRGSNMRCNLRGRCSIWWGSRLTLLAPRLLNDVSYVTRINHEIHFAWQAQYLVKLDCHFSWQAQHLVTFWEIAGARNVVFFNTKSFPRSDE